MAFRFNKEDMSGNNKITITQAAQMLGVVPKTIIRWEQSGKIKKAKRDWRNWRVYSSGEIDEMRGFYEALR